MDQNNVDNINPFELREIAYIVKKRYKLVLTLFFIGVVFTSFYNYNSKPYYQKVSYITHHTLSGVQVVYVLKGLTTLFEDNNLVEMSKVMNLDKSIIEQIRSIRFSDVSKEHNEKTFEVNLTTFDPTILDTLLVGIMHYIENSDLIINELSIKLKKYNGILNKIKVEIANLERTDDVINKYLENPSVKHFPLIEKYDIPLTLVELKQKESAIIAEKEYIKDFIILSSRVNPTQPAGPNRLKWILLSCIGSLIISIIIANIIENWKTVQ